MIQNDDLTSGDTWGERLARAIPGGAHTYSKGADQYPSNAPPILTRGEGAYVWDPDGRKFLDYGMGLRSVTLGYAYPPVLKAAKKQMELGNNLTRPSLIELEAAERLIDLIPSAEMAKFAKNGSNVTTAAVKLARAVTGRDLICVPRQQPFMSFDDWFIGSTVVTRGIPEKISSLTLSFDYGHLESLQEQFAAHPGQIACVILEPATSLLPCPSVCADTMTAGHRCSECPLGPGNFLQEVQALCQEQGALFILDEMITGFRWDLRGAQTIFGVTPDITTFGKGMANGFSVAALVGRREVMDLGSINRPGTERTFLLSTTHGAEMAGLGAFMAAADTYEAEDVCGHLWSYLHELRVGLLDAARHADVADHIKLVGPDIGLEMVTLDQEGHQSSSFRTLFNQELIRRGVLMPAFTPSLAHGPDELAVTINAAAEAFSVYRQALDRGLEGLLDGPATRPVFRKYN